MRARERELTQSLEEVSRKRNEAAVRRAETRARTEAIAERAMEDWAMSIDDLGALEGFTKEAEIEARAEVEKLDREMRRLGAGQPARGRGVPRAGRARGVPREPDRGSAVLEARPDEGRSRRRRDDRAGVQRGVRGRRTRVRRCVPAPVPGRRRFPQAHRPDRTSSDSGIEVEARPPGKNVRKLSLLSGGERSLVALAFLFAIFRSRPSPFYLLDEVEAALDDVNLHRFLGLIEELEERAQVLIVTHQKRTMEAADVLYGVSMAKDGVSRVVAKRMEDVTV